MRHGFLIIVFVIVILTTFTAGQSGSDATLAFVGGRIYASPTTSPIDNGVVIVRAGKIVDVGQRQSVNIPVGAAIVTLAGRSSQQASRTATSTSPRTSGTERPTSQYPSSTSNCTRCSFAMASLLS